MAENKTQPTKVSVESFLNSIEDETKRNDSFTLRQIMQDITGEPAVMWGPSIVGFGTYHYKYESGREGDFMIVGFSPRKQNLTLYIMPGFARYDELMQKLGKYKTGKSCLYLKRLEDVDLEVLKQLIGESVKYMMEKYH
ncbi:MAG: DUF1801 domain-containing protein [Lewinellaceae bacterium]|nr:DUF1801 domain-containing protein [Saprospiraceae bacterium]MCB9339933.1 DUF1801 domain-containing protein [Lewinellaceae bacterium]